jgi:hypothetical protein
MKWFPLVQSIETLEEATTKPDVSRRTFMTCLTILGVGTMAAMTLSLTETDASPRASTGGKAREVAADETMAEADKVQLAASVDPDDPRQSYAYYGRGRRVVRRTYRRTRRVVRRAYRYRRRVVRRTYRRTRRVVRRAYRRRVLYY